MIAFSWTAAAVVVSSAGIFGTLLGGFSRWELGKTFAPAKSHAELTERVAAIEARLNSLPTHDDIRQMVAKLNGVETRVAGLSAALDGMTSAMGRVAHQLDLVMTHLLESNKS